MTPKIFIKKSILKSDYYWEFKPLYDTLPEELTVPEYQEHIFTETMTNKEIMEKWEKKPFTPEQAFAVAADYSQKMEKEQWRIVYFRDEEGLPCRLSVWRDDDGQLGLNVDRVNPDGQWDAGNSTLVSNENSEFLPLDADTLSLGNLDARMKKLEALFNPFNFIPYMKKIIKPKKQTMLSVLTDISKTLQDISLFIQYKTEVIHIPDKSMEEVKEGYITFPSKTAEEIVDECDNSIAGGKLIYNTNWYKSEDFYTKEKCRPRTVKIPTEIQHVGKSWNECHESSTDDMFTLSEIVYMLRESESFRKLLNSSNSVRYTWTNSRDSDGGLVRVGDFGGGGAIVGGWGPGRSSSGMGVCFSRS